MPESTPRRPAPLQWPLALATLLLQPTLPAETIVKSVDAEGNVTYSSTPTADAVETETLTVPEGPSDAQRREALAREQALQRKAEALKKELVETQARKGKSVGEAEERLAEAEERLEEARVQKDTDWQTIADTGGRYLKESYFERVREAEEAVRQAEKELAKARRDTP